MKTHAITDKIKQVRYDLKEMTTAKELFMYIPYVFLSKVAFLFLFLLTISPAYILIRSIFLENHMSFDLYYNQVQLSDSWFTLLQQIGYVGLIIGLIIFVKSIVLHKESFLAYIREHIFPILLFMFVLWSIFSCLFSDNISLSFNGSDFRKEGLHTYFIYSGIFSLGYALKNKKYLMSLFKVFVTVSIILSILMVLNNDYLNRLFTLQTDSAIFYNSNHFAYYLCIAIMINCFLISNTDKLIYKILWLCTFSFLVFTLIKNNSFGPYLSVFITLLVFLTISLLFNRKAFITSLIVFVLFSSISFACNLKRNFIPQETNKISQGISDIVENNEQAPTAGSGRWRLWVHGIKYAFEKPLFGYGQDNLEQRYLKDNIDIDRPHNEFVQHAASLGIPAVLLYISALITMFIPFLMKIKIQNTYSVSLYAAVFAYLVSSFFGNTMYYTTPFFVMLLAMAYSKPPQK